MDRDARKKVFILVVLTGIIALFHYVTPTELHYYHKIHIVLRKLYFLPPVMASSLVRTSGGLRYGLRGESTLYSACISGLAG